MLIFGTKNTKSNAAVTLEQLPVRPQYRHFYLPYAQEGGTHMVLLTESSGDPALLAAPLREIVRSMDSNQPMYNVRTFGNFYKMRAIDTPFMITQIVVTMGLIGLLLALIGIYGLVSYSVARRTREIGVRIAIDANRTDVIRMVLRQGLVLAGIGIGVGGALSVVAESAGGGNDWPGQT